MSLCLCDVIAQPQTISQWYCPSSARLTPLHPLVLLAPLYLTMLDNVGALADDKLLTGVPGGSRTTLETDPANSFIDRTQLQSHCRWMMRKSPADQSSERKK